MRIVDLSRREFVAASGAASLGIFTNAAGAVAAKRPAASKAKNDRPQIGCIGMRYQGSVIARKAQAHGDIVAICDVDRNVREQARASFGSTPRIYEDYREMLARNDLDVITIGAPDHWHAQMLVDACRAGSDVYCEKPLTLTVDEGKHICRAVRETGRVVQVGSWQRSDYRFRLAVEMVRQGRLGKLERVDVVLGKNPTGGPFAVDDPPPELNWDLWQGPTPAVPYIHQRCHYTFRWWTAYSGGKITDFGAHHIDVGQWAINEYPQRIESSARFPGVENGFDVATDFAATFHYPGGAVMTVSDTGRVGVMLTGSRGRIFVNRGGIEGKPVEELKHYPLPREALVVYEHDNFSRPARVGKLEAIVNHMGNFFDCIQTRHTPISDVQSQHRSVTTCHLGNISMRLGRPLQWDAAKETFVGDDEANQQLSRVRRAEFEIA